jgi:hypothetical protein
MKGRAMDHAWTQYRKKQLSEMRPYVQGETLSSDVSISEGDRKDGSPKVGDFIARNPLKPEDQWLVSAEYAAANFEPL